MGMSDVPGHAQDFFQRGHPRDRLEKTVLVHRPHPLFDRRTVYLARLRMIEDHAADRIGHRQDFDDRDLSAVSRSLAGLAADRLIEDRLAPPKNRREPEALGHFGKNAVRSATRLAKLPHQALRHDAVEGRSYEIVLDLH